MPFQKGVSGNPSGGGRAKPFLDALKIEIAAAGTDHRALRQVARSLVARAIAGEINAIKEVADRLDGKVPQGIAGPDGEGPVEMRIGWEPFSE